MRHLERSGNNPLAGIAAYGPKIKGIGIRSLFHPVSPTSYVGRSLDEGGAAASVSVYLGVRQ
jgi:hypothetical protein